MTKHKIVTIQSPLDFEEKDFEYNYNILLTESLDTINTDFDQNTFNMIALWKVNRYPYLRYDLINELNKVAKHKTFRNEHRILLCELLSCKGVGLPMASTFLRFRNPKLFQIIDQRAYRLLMGSELKIPKGETQKTRERACSLYFDYLKQLKVRCAELKIRFEDSDRILYNADKRINKSIKLNNWISSS